MDSPPLCNDSLALACTQNNCLLNVVLLTTCLISPLLFSLSCIRRRRYLYGFRKLPGSDHDLLDTSEPEEWVITISPLIETLELVGLLADFIIGIAHLLHREATQVCPFAFAPVLFSFYLLFLLGGRHYIEGICLQSHSMSLYGVQCICTAFNVPKSFAHEFGTFNSTSTLVRLAIFTALFLFHCTGPLVPSETSYLNYVLSDCGTDQRASLFSRLTFSWLNGLLWKAFRRTVEAPDMYHLHRNQMSELLSRRFHLTAVASSLLLRLCRFFKADILRQGAWGILMSAAVLVPPLLMMPILQYLSSQDTVTAITAWSCVCGLLISGLVTGIADSQCNWIGRNIGAKMRAVLISEIYAKLLRKSIANPSKTTFQPDSDTEALPERVSDGVVLNLISADVEAVSEISGSIYLVWVTFPMQITIGTYLLYKILGISGVIGVMVMVTILPLNVLLSLHLMTVQRRVLSASDKRIQATNEVLHKIRTVKYCAWETPFGRRVLDRRESEITAMRMRFIWWSINMTLFHSLPIIMTALTCFLYTIVWGHKLETSIAFPALAIFGVLRIPLNRMAESITFWLGAQVSLIRIDNFLKEQETKNFIELSQSDASVIQFESATLAWPVSKSPETSAEESIPLTELPFKLQSLQLYFEKDMLNVVCGPTSSGKTSLLLALLGEMELIGGRVLFPREVAGVGSATWQISMDSFSETTAYCPQEPWIMNRSIRSNTLMGLPFDGVRYQEVLHAVSLLRDLAALDDGDQTFAGDNGSKLSGGQNHRVALARAIYSPSRYVLLDDCLSALDSTTATHVFFHAIIGPLMRGRTCIFATHNTQLAIPHSQQVVILCSGRVKAQGTGEQLVSAGFLDADIMKNKIEPPLPASGVETSVDSTKHVPGTPGASTSLKSLDRESLSVISYAEAPKTKFDFAETKAEGAVSWSITHIYLSALGSKWYWILVLLGFAVQQLASLGTRLWIKEWASQYDMLNKGTSVSNPAIAEEMKPRKVNALYYWVIYTIIGLAYALITFSRDLIVFEGSLRASSKLFERLLNSILHAKLIFFDRVPLGQITNRFSRDTEVLDQWLSTFAISAFQIVVGLMTIIIFISVIIPEFLLVAAFICLAYFVVTAVYIGAARDFKRIEAVKRSPLYQQFEETIAGCVSIRAYGQSPVFTAQNHSLVDGINEPWLLVWASKEWLTLRIGILSSFIVFSTGAFVLWNVDSVSPGAAGLVLTYAATFTESILWLVQIYAIIQQNLVSVERIAEFTEIEQEEQEQLERPVQNLPYNWPSQGRVQFHDYSARYAPELALTLKSVSFAVGAGERCAIIGRTGAGKSTLALALIRGVEAEPGGGRIEIDGVDIASVSLKQLRQAVIVVPQDPKLFEGSLRENLAPLQCHSDDKMLDALRAVHLLSTNNADLITYSDLDRAAETLSRGQRQLLCIARGLLRRSRILVLDEATVSVDRATDVAIQGGLRATAAAGTTVLTIAHKLLTIADYDRIIVLDAGRVVEQGSIKELLGHRGESSLFHRMCEESGDFNEIKKAAGL